MLVYRDRNGASDFVGRIDYSTDKPATFIYDRSYLDRGTSAGELGISELLPLDNSPYYIEEFGPQACAYVRRHLYSTHGIFNRYAFRLWQPSRH